MQGQERKDRAVTRIEWHHVKFDGRVGKVGPLRVFSIHRTVLREEPPYRLDTRFPVNIPKDLEYADTMDEAEEHAEEILRRFLDVIGAEWKTK